MSDDSHRLTQIYEHRTDHKFSLDLTQLQLLTLSHRHHIEQQIAQELCHNPALEIREEPSFLDDIEPQEREDDWNADYDKPEDEFETGDSSASKNAAWDIFDIASNLEQAAIQRFRDNPGRLEHALRSVDYFRIHGYLAEDSAPELYEDLKELEKAVSYSTFPSLHPTFEVTVEDNRVEAYAFTVGLNLRYVRGIRRQSSRARKFIKLLQDRKKLLDNVAYHILGILQEDFFCQDDFDKALRHLVPISSAKVGKLISSPFTLGTKYFSKLGDHLVSCSFGTIPLNLFLQDKASIVRLLLNFARNEGKTTKREQINWIANCIRERARKWEASDMRHEFIAPLMILTEDDIKYARKVGKKGLSTSPLDRFSEVGIATT
jgi:hypothetical protein